jgi:hypothetical protein
MDPISETKQLEEINKILNSINKTIDQILNSNNTTLELEYLFPDKDWPTLEEYIKDKDV